MDNLAPELRREIMALGMVVDKPACDEGNENAFVGPVTRHKLAAVLKRHGYFRSPHQYLHHTNYESETRRWAQVDRLGRESTVSFHLLVGDRI